MSWLFSQALVEEYLVDICLDGEQSVQSSGNRTQQAYCAPDKMTAFSRLSRFGMTFKPLTESRGEELLTLYREGFHAKTLVQQDEAQELTESAAGCGEKWRASFTKYDPDSRLWKTHQCSLVEDLEPFLETWPQWGLMRDGECWEQRTLEQTTRGTEFGLLQETWPTPRSCSAMAATITPESAWNEKRNPNLETIVGQRLWPTPTTRDYKGANGFETTQKKIEEGLRAHMGQLPNVVQQLEQKAIGGTLNPTWVEWLMGWPLGWTDLKPLEMDKSHSVQQVLGES
jgi:hypothetical protein